MAIFWVRISHCLPLCQLEDQEYMQWSPCVWTSPRQALLLIGRVTFGNDRKLFTMVIVKRTWLFHASSSETPKPRGFPPRVSTPLGKPTHKQLFRHFHVVLPSFIVYIPHLLFFSSLSFVLPDLFCSILPNQIKVVVIEIENPRLNNNAPNHYRQVPLQLRFFYHHKPNSLFCDTNLAKKLVHHPAACWWTPMYSHLDAHCWLKNITKKTWFNRYLPWFVRNIDIWIPWRYAQYMAHLPFTKQSTNPFTK